MHGITSLNNQKRFERVAMSKGCIIFAHNGAYDYVNMARVAAMLVQKYLHLPVTLITNTDADPSIEFERVINVGAFTEPDQLRIIDNKVQPWHNRDRYTAYALSPYDQTLLIDADYFVFNDNLLNLFNTDINFACYDTVWEIDGLENLERNIHGTNIPMQWATVIYFTKSELAKNVFEFMQYIKEHNEFYSLMYGYRSDYFRNDYALSIAIQVLTGQLPSNFYTIPGVLHTITDKINVLEIRPDSTIPFASLIMGTSFLKGANIHFLDKRQLFEGELLPELARVAYADS